MARISERFVWKEFSRNLLTHSWAHYLTAIFALREEQGYARLSDIARRLGISKGSLSVSLKPLLKKRLVLEDSNKHFTLSAEAEKMAMNVQKAYMVIHYLLSGFLGVEEKTAQIDACKIEHLLSEESTGQLLKLVKALKASEELRNILYKEMNQRHDCTFKCVITDKEEDICTR